MWGGSFGALLRDTRGTVSIEFSIVLAGLVGAALTFGSLVGPAVHDYSDRLTALATRAESVLSALESAPAP